MTAPRQTHGGMVATMAALRAGCMCPGCVVLRVRIIGASRRQLRAAVERMAVITSPPQSDDPRERWDVSAWEVAS